MKAQIRRISCYAEPTYLHGGGENGLLGSFVYRKTRRFASHAVSSEFLKIGGSIVINKTLFEKISITKHFASQ
jgi:hypothetical protein